MIIYVDMLRDGGGRGPAGVMVPPFSQKVFIKEKKTIKNNTSLPPPPPPPPKKKKLIGFGPFPKKFMCFLLLLF
jgi:hypothetical protein